MRGIDQGAVLPATGAGCRRPPTDDSRCHISVGSSQSPSSPRVAGPPLITLCEQVPPEVGGLGSSTVRRRFPVQSTTAPFPGRSLASRPRTIANFDSTHQHVTPVASRLADAPGRDSRGSSRVPPWRSQPAGVSTAVICTPRENRNARQRHGSLATTDRCPATLFTTLYGLNVTAEFLG